MAGDWLKVEKSTPEKPEIYAIADRLGLDPDVVFAKCFRLWSWADSHTTDGNASGVTFVTLLYVDRNVGVTGFAAAMLAVGWLESVPGAENDRVRFPKFNRHMGQSAKARTLTAERVASHRLRKCNDSSVTKPLPEKRREENKEASPLLERFARFWKAYPRARRQGKKAALRAFEKLRPSAELLETILVALADQAQWPSYTRENFQFMKHPATWLNQGCWDDERPPDGSTNGQHKETDLEAIARTKKGQEELWGANFHSAQIPLGDLSILSTNGPTTTPKRLGSETKGEP